MCLNGSVLALIVSLLSVSKGGGVRHLSDSAPQREADGAGAAARAVRGLHRRGVARAG